MRFKYTGPLTLFAAMCFHSCKDELHGNGAYDNPDHPNNRRANHVIPTIAPVFDSCTGNGLGLYVWGHEYWNMVKSPIVDFLLKPNARQYACGDIYVNVADYTAPDYIPNEHYLLPFIKNIRATGNRAIVYLVYGDVHVSGNGAVNGPYDFANVFFDWIDKLSQLELDSILPLGLSFDCEHLSVKTISDALTQAQNRKQVILASRLHNDPTRITIQWTIEGEKKPHDTDTIMRLADSALMMAYRNHAGPTALDPEGADTTLRRLFDFMLTEQCRYCLDDAYAKQHYKAKITIMMEADCACGKSCGKISFCAFDASVPDWGGRQFNTGIEYMMDTLTKTKEAIQQGMSPETYTRLFGNPQGHSLFAIHNWQWFTCFFQDPSIELTTPWGRRKDHTCRQYASYSQRCRNL